MMCTYPGGKEESGEMLFGALGDGQVGCMTTSQISRVTLNNGVRMPLLGFGVYQIPAEQTEQAVTDALAVGYRLLDTAEAYQNEEAVGRAIASSGVARDEIFVTTKLWIHSGEEAAKRAFAASLERLGLDYVDLYLIHQPLGDYNQRHADHEVMRDHGVVHESWGPFAEGKNNIFSDPTLSEIGAAHGKSVAQVILRWLTQRGIVAVSKSVRAERMRENIDVFDFELSDDEMTRIAGLDAGGTLFFDHADPAMVSWLNSRKGD